MKFTYNLCFVLFEKLGIKVGLFELCQHLIDSGPGLEPAVAYLMAVANPHEVNTCYHPVGFFVNDPDSLLPVFMFPVQVLLVLLFLWVNLAIYLVLQLKNLAELNQGPGL